MRHNIEQHNLDADMGAAAAAESFGLGNALFKDLQVGNLFRFRFPADIMRKTTRGYVDISKPDKEWKTGQRTAVWRAPN